MWQLKPTLCVWCVTGMCHVYAKSVCLAVLFCCVNISLVGVCHERAMCDTRHTHDRHTHKWHIQTRQQRTTHTLNIVMTPTCDNSNLHCVCDVSQVCVMSMLRVCAWRYCSVVWVYRLCVSVMSVQCVTHTAHSWQTHTSGIFRRDNSQWHTHTLNIVMTPTTAKCLWVISLHNVNCEMKSGVFQFSQ